MQFFIKTQKSADEIPQWTILELQGELESRNGELNHESKFVGDLHFNNTKDTPTLIIGHHILHGKIVELDTHPLVLLHKVQSSEGSTSYNVHAVIKRKLIFKTRPKPIIAHVPNKTL